MASFRSSMRPLLSVSILMVMVLLADVAAADDQQRTPNNAAGAVQKNSYLRGNTNVATTKGAVVTEEMHPEDFSYDSFVRYEMNDYGSNPGGGPNCKRNCWRP